MKTRYILGVLLALAMVGCAKAPNKLPAGAINSFDATTYDYLVTTEGAITGFKSQFASLPINQQVIIRPKLNTLIGAYDQANTAWQQYHAGGATPASAVSAAVGQVVAALADLQSAMTGGK